MYHHVPVKYMLHHRIAVQFSFNAKSRLKGGGYDLTLIRLQLDVYSHLTTYVTPDRRPTCVLAACTYWDYINEQVSVSAVRGSAASDVLRHCDLIDL